MKKIALIATAILATAAVAGAADASQGCGRNAHRTVHGHCVANAAHVIVTPHGLAVGTFYPGHGYWDGHSYYQHRERWHGGWRYR